MRNKCNLIKHIKGWGKLYLILVAIVMGASVIMNLLGLLFGKPIDLKESIISSITIIGIGFSTSLLTWYLDPEMFDKAGKKQTDDR